MRIVLFAALVAALIGAAAVAKEKVPPRDPAELGRVAIFPFREAQGGSEFRTPIVEEVTETLVKRGIALVPQEQVAAAIRKLELSPDEEASRTPAKLKALADELGAQHVVTGVLHDVRTETRGSGAFTTYPIVARAQVRVLECKGPRFLDQFEKTASTEPGGVVFRSESAQRRRIVREAVHKALEALTAQYPEKKKR